MNDITCGMFTVRLRRNENMRGLGNMSNVRIKKVACSFEGFSDICSLSATDETLAPGTFGPLVFIFSDVVPMPLSDL